MTNDNEFSYDFCLSDDLNSKLKTAVNMLRNVRLQLELEKEDYTKDFERELKESTERIMMAMTVSAAIQREIAQRGTESRFVKTGRGLFAAK